jgi:hypothetical protein
LGLWIQSQSVVVIIINYLPEQVLSAQFPLPLKLCEVDVCNPLKVLLTLPLPLGPEPASPNALIVLEVEHELAPGKEHPPPPLLHAILPLFVIQLACAVCTGIIILTTIPAVTRAKVTVAIAVAIPNVVVFVMWFIFYLPLYDTLVTLISIYELR